MTTPRPPHSPLPTHPSATLKSKLVLTFLLITSVIAGVYLSLTFINRPSPIIAPRTPSTDSPRIASLSPALSIILRDLNLSHLIVARHNYDLILDKSIPVAWDEQPDYEQLLAATPTHILLQLQSTKIPTRLPDLAATHNWQIADFPILALDDIKTATTNLANLFNPGADKPLLDQMDRAWSKRPNIFTGRILLLAGLDPPAVLGPGSWHYQLLERLGATPAISQGSQWITLDAEDILALKPDAILLILPRSPTAPPSTPTIEDLHRQLGRLATLNIPAIHNSRIALIDNPLAHTPSTAMIGLADEIAAVLQKWK